MDGKNSSQWMNTADTDTLHQIHVMPYIKYSSSALKSSDTFFFLIYCRIRNNSTNAAVPASVFEEAHTQKFPGAH